VQPGAELDDAIGGLYATFAGYPLRGWTEPCMHCHTVEDERVVHSRPLRDLRPADLSQFAADLLMTWGEVVDFKHFLPRLFEVVAREHLDYPDIETVVGALDRGAWRTWPAAEQAAVARFLMAFWRAHLADHPALHRTDDVLGAIATAADDMAPYLDAWFDAEPDGASPAIHFAEFLVDNPQGVHNPLRNPWLNDRPHQEAQVQAWLLAVSPVALARMEAAFLSTSDDETLELLAEATDVASWTLVPAAPAGQPGSPDPESSTPGTSGTSGTSSTSSAASALRARRSMPGSTP
jgi:hypothetical protein